MTTIWYMTTGETKTKVEENKRKHNEIKKIIKLYKNSEILVMGDMNGNREKVNKNEELMLSFTEKNDLENGNLTKTIRKITWRRARGNEKSQIDYVLYSKMMGDKINKIWIDEEKNFNVSPDHNIMMVEYSHKEKKIKSHKNKKKMEKEKCKLVKI